MNSPLNSWLTNRERETIVPKEARAALREQMFGAPSRWRWIALLFPVTIATAAVLLFVSPQKNILTPQEVLAAALSSSGNIPDGMVEKVTQTIHISTQIDLPSYTLFTDGIRFFSPNTPEQWTQKNGDHLTLTQYINASYGIARWLMGDRTYLDETRTDIDGWQNTSAINFCEDANCQPEAFAAKLAGTVTMTQEVQPDGTAVYKIVSAGSPPDVRSLFSQTETATITRTDIIRASDFRFLSHSWDAVMVDGTTRTGGITYTYEQIPLNGLGHPFTLEWWLSTVDPQAKATVFCSAYSSASCADATEKTETHEPLHIPEGWLEEPALGSRKQILTAE